MAEAGGGCWRGRSPRSNVRPHTPFPAWCRTKGPDIPEGRFGAAGAVLDGRLYAVGGCTNTDCSNTVYVFDPRSGAWSRAADYPQTISWASCGAINGKLYCEGGNHNYVETGVGYVYDPASNSWQSIADMPVAVLATTSLHHTRAAESTSRRPTGTDQPNTSARRGPVPRPGSSSVALKWQGRGL
ncbi:kelch repeat-containing protein [Streptomyces sp. NPDC001982]|uniref:Kelch repeat-containing protein n=1 Tax=Streptomyces sp. NPDC001982 TaxID=3154405 RepID=UPI00332B748C